MGVGLTAILPVSSWVNVLYIYSGARLKYPDVYVA